MKTPPKHTSKGTPNALVHNRTNDTFFGVQAKLSVGKPGDVYEQEADTMAEKVVERTNNRTTSRTEPFFPGSTSTPVQTKPESPFVQEKPLASSVTPVVQLESAEEESVQEKCDACEKEKVQRMPFEDLQKQEEEEAAQTKEIQLQEEEEAQAQEEEEAQTKEIQLQEEEEAQAQEEEEAQAQEEEEAAQAKESVQLEGEEEEAQAQEEEEAQTLQMMEEEEAQTKESVQLEGEEEEAQTKEVQLQEEEEAQAQEEEEAQAKAVNPGAPRASLSKDIGDARGKGSPLKEGVKQQMESGFGADFSGVRVHTDSKSAEMNKELGAKAFTAKNDIFFNEGQFNPATKEGQTLLAHELTHTLQQGASGAKTGMEETETGGENSTSSASGGGTQADPSQPAEEVPAETGDVATEDAAVEGAEGAEVPAEGAEGDGEGKEAQEGKGKGKKKGKGKGDAKTTPRSPEEDPNFKKMEGRVEDRSTQQQAHEPAEASAGAAQSAAVSPANERDSMAQSGQVDQMDEAEAGEFSAEDFKAKLMERIEGMQLPANQEEADDFEDNNNIDEVNQAAMGDVQGEQAAASGAIEQTSQAEPNPDAIPEREVTPLPEAPIGEQPAAVNPEQAMPPKRGAAEVETPLQDNAAEVDQQMEDNEITEEQLANSNEPKFQEALSSKKTAQEDAATRPTQLRQQEAATRQGAEAQATANADASLQGMHQDRANLLNQVTADQQTTGTTDTAERQRIADEINTIYENTKTDVETILSDLDTEVSQKFSAGTATAKQKFEDYVDRKMDAYKSRRYSGLTGKGRWLKDKFAGMPDEVNEFFVDGKQEFIDHMDTVITEVANIVATKLNEAKTRISTGKQEVEDYVNALPENLQQIGRDAADEINTKFDELEESVNSKQDELIDSLADQYNAALEEVDARIEEMKAANRGLIDMALDAIAGVIKTIIEIKNMLTELLAGAISAIGAIISDPIGFLGNLISGIGQGFTNFGANILTHLQSGLIQWLTGTLGPVGITIPDDLFSLKGIFSLVAQILGITWDFIRRKAVKLLGEPMVQALETGFEIFMIIKNDGINGLWEYLKEQFNDLKETVIDAIKSMVITTVIEAGIKWVLGLMNPASAFVKACMMIIDVVRFFIERGSQIIELVKAFVDGVKAVASGSVSAVAAAIENALARALPVVIGFLASLLGIGGLARKVQKIIGKIRKRIDKAVDKLIMKAKSAFKGLVKKGKAKAKGLLQSFVDWLGFKKTFKTADKKSHKLYVKGEGKNAELWVQSTPKKVKDLLDNHPDQSNPALGEARKHMNDFYASAPELAKLDAQYETATGAKQKTIAGKIRKHIEGVTGTVTKLAEALKTLGIDGTMDATVLTKIDPNSGKLLTSKSAKPLTALPGNTKGNPNAAGAGDIPGWPHLTKVKNSGVDDKIFDKYVRFHIIHDQMHGPANDTNLVAATKDANNDYYRNVEIQILRKLYTPGTIMYLDVTLSYHGSFPEFLHKATANWGYMKLDPRTNDPVPDTSKTGGSKTVTSDAPPAVTGPVTVKLHGKGRSQLTSAPIKLPVSTARRLVEALKAHKTLDVYSAIDLYYTASVMYTATANPKPFSTYKAQDKAAIASLVAANPNIDLTPI